MKTDSSAMLCKFMRSRKKTTGFHKEMAELRARILSLEAENAELKKALSTDLLEYFGSEGNS
jgi:cell division protein FtsB